MYKRVVVFLMALALCLPALAKPKKKIYENSATDVFDAALRTARERHVVTYVNEKMLMLTFETGQSLLSEGFVANASVEALDGNRCNLIVNVQNKKGVSWGAGDRMADKFFSQVNDELAGASKQKSAIKPEQEHIMVPPPKAIPSEPTMTAAADLPGVVHLAASSQNAEVSVDGNFVGNAPVDLKLAPGKHTIQVTASGYRSWSRELSVLAGSEVHLNAGLENQ
ncbi:MAG TPA: PEGA domain-containing protein [Candidatus Angelobacter sp.]|nr:PEGA domain-containing protein [Candidatus Angelobacter sp.]